MRQAIDWPHWQRLRSVKVWEATLLSINTNPAAITQDVEAGVSDLSWDAPWLTDASFRSPADKVDYHQRLRLVHGYLEDHQAFNLVSRDVPNKNMWEIRLAEFAEWAQQMSLVIPPELSVIAAAPLKAAPHRSPATPPTSDKPLGTRERENLLRLVIGMAIGGYGYAPAAAKNTVVTEIVRDLERFGIALSDDTVRKYLKEGAALLPGRKPA